MTETIKLKALDSFHHAPLGTVPAKSEFQASKVDADGLIKAGLAELVIEAPKPNTKGSK